MSTRPTSGFGCHPRPQPCHLRPTLTVQAQSRLNKELDREIAPHTLSERVGADGWQGWSAALASEHQRAGFVGQRSCARVEMDVCSGRSGRVGQCQAPPGEIVESGCVAEYFDSFVADFDGDGPAFGRRDDTASRVVARHGQRYVTHASLSPTSVAGGEPLADWLNVPTPGARICRRASVRHDRHRAQTRTRRWRGSGHRAGPPGLL
jgi:hypothetical protein